VPAYIHGSLATQPREQEPKVKIKETKKLVTRKKTLPIQEKLLYLFTVVICAVVAGVIIWRYAQIYEMNMRIQQVEKQIQLLEAENTVLKYKVSELSKPERLNELAKQWSYGPPEVPQIKTVTPPKNSTAAKSTPSKSAADSAKKPGTSKQTP
jgi:cell division protein FtsL